MTLNAKIVAAKRVIYLFSGYKRPVVMASFGKDSMVLLALIRGMGLKFDVLFHREPFYPVKYQFANGVIEEWGLSVYDYPPVATALIGRNGLMEVMNYYDFGTATSALPTGIIDPDYENDEETFLCGRDDLLKKPLGRFNYPWDAVFLGHKSSDVDPLRGPMPLALDVKQTPNCPDALFPLREWTDEDVWAYTEAEHLPVHTSRYERNGQWKEKADKTFNPDYFPACMRCIDKTQTAFVLCPKTGLVINNVADKVQYVDETKPEVDYAGQPAGGN